MLKLIQIITVTAILIFTANCTDSRSGILGNGNIIDVSLISEQELNLNKDFIIDQKLILIEHPLLIDKGNYLDYYVTSAIRAVNGDILVFCKCGDSHADPPPNSIVMFVSDDEGITWSSQVVVAGNARYSYLNPIAGVTESGRILLMYAGRHVDRVKACMRYSDDHGASWSTELNIIDLGITKHNYVNSVGNIITNSNNGDILFAQRNTIDNNNALVLYKSTVADDGLNWSLVGDIIASDSNLRYYEPCLTYIGNRLFCGIRVRSDDIGSGQVFGFVYSDNHGLTWTNLHLIREMGGSQWTYIPTPWGVIVAARGPVYDPSDGISITGYPRTNTMIFSSNDGIRFVSEFLYLGLPVEHGEGGYCSSVMLSDGDIMLFQANIVSLLSYRFSFQYD